MIAPGARSTTVAVGGILAGVALLVDLPLVVRAPLVAVFVAVCPALPWTVRMHPGSVGDLAAITLATNTGLLVGTAEVMALAGWWSAPAGFVVLALVCVAGLVVPRRPGPLEAALAPYGKERALGRRATQRTERAAPTTSPAASARRSRRAKPASEGPVSDAGPWRSERR